MMLKQESCPNCLSNSIIEKNGKLYCTTCMSEFTKGRYSFTDDVIQNKFERAIEYRTILKFDESLEILDYLIELYPTCVELYYQRVLSKFGVQFVQENDETKITISRLIKESVSNLYDVKKTFSLAKPNYIKEYEETFKRIEEIRCKYLKISEQAPDYDIFISFKVHPDGENATYTLDYILAQELYDELTKKGYKVFFSPKSLVAGIDYEPYIFHALESSEIMLLINATPDPTKDYVNSHWVKNEWSRYLAMTKEPHANKRLIPVVHNGYKPENLPGVLSKLQCLSYDGKFWNNLNVSLKEAGLIKEKQVKKPEGQNTKKLIWVFLSIFVITCLSIVLIFSLKSNDDSSNNNNNTVILPNSTTQRIEINYGNNLQMCVGDSTILKGQLYGFTNYGQETPIYSEEGIISYNYETNEIVALKEGQVKFQVEVEGVKSNTITIYVYKTNYKYEGKKLTFNNEENGVVISQAILENPKFVIEEVTHNPNASSSPLWRLNFEADITKTYGDDSKMRIIVKMFDENEQLIARFSFDTPDLPLNEKKHIKVTSITANQFYKMPTDTKTVTFVVYNVILG